MALGSGTFCAAFVAATLVLVADLRGQENVTLRTVLDRLHAYLAEYAQRLPATIASEHYEQEAGSFASRQHVVLESEFGIMRLASPGGWLGLRDVLSVNGRPLAGHEERLHDLFSSPSQQGLQQARRIALENARFNVGRIQRTINDPAVVLELLDGRNAPRMKYTKIGEEPVEGGNLWTIKFDERRRPTIIQSLEGRDAPARGTAWVEPITGRLERAEIQIDGGDNEVVGFRHRLGFTATIDVVFREDPRLGFWVPSSMTERYLGRDLSSAGGVATYSNYRTFGVKTRIISP